MITKEKILKKISIDRKYGQFSFVLKADKKAFVEAYVDLIKWCKKRQNMKNISTEHKCKWIKLFQEKNNNFMNTYEIIWY